MRSHSKILVCVAVLAALASVAAACGGGEVSHASAGRYGDMYDALCEATEAAGQDDTAGAERLFFDQVHQPLHELAPQVAGVDRGAAARLLEAKEAAEAAIADGGDGSTELARLTAAARGALETIDEPTPRPCAERQ